MFRVFAENAEGISAPLEGDASITCRRAPEKPGIISGKLRASKITLDSVTLDWLPPLDNGGESLTGYIIEVETIEITTKKTTEWKLLAQVREKN